MMSRVKISVALCITVLLIATPTLAEDDVPVAANAPRANDHLDLDITSIRGNQELPRVMYIVPWKDPAMENLVGKPVNSLVDEVLRAVDRDVFRRQTAYFEQLYEDPDPGAAE